MKTNDFLCHPCAYKWEQLWSKDDKITCPKCKSKKVRKLIASPIIHMKGISDASLRSQGIID
jgi:putative FmdB family regulatory protein